jgi:hypothetical protein
MSIENNQAWPPEDFSGWYNTAIRQADLIAESPTRGVWTLLPRTTTVWNSIRTEMTDGMRKIGVGEVVMPTLFPMSLLEKEADHVEFNKVDPVTDGRKWSAYTGGGFLNYYAVKDLTDNTARMKVKDRVDGTVLLSSEAEDAPLDVIDIDVSPSLKKTTISIAASDTTALAFKKGVTDMEMISQAGVVVARLKLTSSGSIGDHDPVRVSDEVTN